MRLDPSMQRSLGELDAVDLIVVGSGAAGLTAALTAILEGLTVIVLEISSKFGGTTARSSGTVWIPDNQLMRAAGLAPDRQAAKAYLSDIVNGHARPEQWSAYLDEAPKMQADLEARAGIAFRPFMKAPDYRSSLKGAALGGRALEPMAFDGRLLGNWFDKLAEPMRELTVLGGMMLTRGEAQRLIHAERSASAILEGLRLVSRHLRDRVRFKRGTRLVMGNALVARLLHGVLTRGGSAFTDVHIDRLHFKEDRVSGVSGVHLGRAFTLDARAGVVLAGGGFPANEEMRARYLPALTPCHTPASPFANGSTINLGVSAGGHIGPDAGSNAMWFPSSLWPRKDGGVAVYPHIALDRAKPGSIIVDQNGERFANEAASYHDFCCAMFDHGATAVPAYMIAGRDFIRRYGLGVIRPRTPSLKAYLSAGYLRHGDNPDALARTLGLPQGSLGRSIDRFNAFAKSGHDADFKRGDSAYERSNGDEDRGFKNPCLGPVATDALYAVALWPTPLATARGLLCNETGNVLGDDGRPLPGLYAAGNDMQSVFGGQYPGAGAQIGPAMTFAWTAARHAASHMRKHHGRTG